MTYFLLAESEIWYIWPETNASTVFQAILFIIIFVLIILLGKSVFLRRKITNSSWTHILNYAYNKKLTAKEVTILEHFFKTVDLSINEKSHLISDKKLFQEHLYEYLKKYHSDSVEVYVKVLDKLFLVLESQGEIKSLLDIQIGESCAVEFDGLYFLARVMNKSHREASLSVQDSALDKNKDNENVNLYFYRNNLGGFLIPGIVKKVNSNGILFYQEGEIQTKGEEHLFAEIVKDVEIFPWGIELQKSEPNEKEKLASEILDLELNDKANSENSEDSEIKSDVEGSIPLEKQEESYGLKATMVRLSDRAALLNIKDSFFNDAVLKKVDIWQMTINITSNFTPVNLKGKIFKSTLYLDSYIFKFIALSDPDTSLLFEEIKRHSPVRGYIS